MTHALRVLLTEAVDYAGLYPPAKLPIESAVREYLGHIGGAESWFVDRFVVGVNHFDALENELAEAASSLSDDIEIGVSLVTPAIQDGSHAPVVLHKAGECLEGDRAVVEALEVKMPSSHGLNGALKAFKKKNIEDLDLAVYFEFPWGEDMAYAISESASIFETIGFKARTGGVTADLFPSTENLAAFIVNMASLDAPFKFTAGLHKPLRHFDEELGIHRHGFLNVLLASAMAVTQDLNETETEQILLIEDPAKFEFQEDKILVDGAPLTIPEIDEFWETFGGFGSCSVSEPLESLAQLGYC